MVRISIIVPTYHRPDLLRHCLESVRRQSFTDFECLVVEDGPHPKPTLLPDDRRFRLLTHATNLGAAAARNTGLDAARGDFVTFADDDDELDPERFAASLEHLAPHRVVVSGRRSMAGGNLSFRSLHGDVSDTILDGYVPHVGQVMVPRQRAVRFDARYRAVEDVEWWLRQARELPVASIPHAGYLVREHGGARHGNGGQARALWSRVLLREHAAYFAGHRRAHGFRLERLARLEAGLGRPSPRIAARALWRSPRPGLAWLVVALAAQRLSQLTTADVPEDDTTVRPDHTRR